MMGNFSCSELPHTFFVGPLFLLLLLLCQVSELQLLIAVCANVKLVSVGDDALSEHAADPQSLDTLE